MDFALAIFAAVVSLIITYFVIEHAVRAAMIHHYKIIRWYEATGEWLTLPSNWKDAPRTLEGEASKLVDPSA